MFSAPSVVAPTNLGHPWKDHGYKGIWDSEACPRRWCRDVTGAQNGARRSGSDRLYLLSPRHPIDGVVPIGKNSATPSRPCP